MLDRLSFLVNTTVSSTRDAGSTSRLNENWQQYVPHPSLKAPGVALIQVRLTVADSKMAIGKYRRHFGVAWGFHHPDGAPPSVVHHCQ